MSSAQSQPRLTRRRLLQTLTAGGAAMALHGCKSMPSMPSLGGMVDRAAGGDRRFRVNEKFNGNRPWSPDDAQLSDRAKNIIGPALRGQPVGLVASDLAHPDRLPEVERDWMSIMEVAEAAGETTLNQHLSLSMLGAPIMGQGGLQIDPQLMDKTFKGNRASLLKHAIEVPPGTMVRAQFEGACMDDKMPAPSRGETLTLRPVTGYVHRDLEDLYSGVNQMRADERLNLSEYQHLIWAIRNVETKDTPYIANLQPKHIDQLNQAAPEAGQCAHGGGAQSDQRPDRQLGVRAKSALLG